MRGGNRKIDSDSSARIFSLRDRPKIPLVALLCALALGCHAQTQFPAPENVTPASSGYKTEIFNLVDPDGDQYGTPIGNAVLSAFDRMLNLSGLDLQMLRRRLLSGPATEGSLWKIGNSQGWLYHICQANQCNVTNVAFLYDEQTHRAAGRLLYRCTPKWLGNPSDAEKALIENKYPIKIDQDDVRVFCGKE